MNCENRVIDEEGRLVPLQDIHCFDADTGEQYVIRVPITLITEGIKIIEEA